MTIPDPTDRIKRQGRALVRPTEALGTIEPSGPLERALACLLLALYKRRLRRIVKAVPACVSAAIPSASERVVRRRAVLWMSENSGGL